MNHLATRSPISLGFLSATNRYLVARCRSPKRPWLYHWPIPLAAAPFVVSALHVVVDTCFYFVSQVGLQPWIVTLLRIFRRRLLLLLRLLQPRSQRPVTRLACLVTWTSPRVASNSNMAHLKCHRFLLLLLLFPTRWSIHWNSQTIPLTPTLISTRMLSLMKIARAHSRWLCNSKVMLLHLVFLYHFLFTRQL